MISRANWSPYFPSISIWPVIIHVILHYPAFKRLKPLSLVLPCYFWIECKEDDICNRYVNLPLPCPCISLAVAIPSYTQEKEAPLRSSLKMGSSPREASVLPTLKKSSLCKKNPNKQIKIPKKTTKNQEERLLRSPTSEQTLLECLFFFQMPMPINCQETCLQRTSL